MDWSKRYNYNFPTSIRFGKGVTEELANHLLDVNKKKPFIVTDPTLATLDFIQDIICQLKDQKLEATIFSNVDKNPIEANVLDGVEEFRSSNSDCIIGIGGGASLDVARAIALKANHSQNLFAFDDALGGDKLVTGEIPYFVAIPTTSGTGSELGRSAVISENDSHKKRILFSPRLMPSQVFADPQLTMSLPPAVAAATGMDALSHNLEAYFSPGFAPLCDGVALEAIRLIANSLEGAVLSPSIENKSKMMMAALMGATAFQKGLGVVHSLAHPLSTLYDLHHGLANALMLPIGVEFNSSVCQEKILHLCKLLEIERSTASFINWIKNLNRKINMPAKLAEVGVQADGIEKLSLLAFEDVCHQSNPRKLTLDNFKELYQKAL